MDNLIESKKKERQELLNEKKRLKEKKKKLLNKSMTKEIKIMGETVKKGAIGYLLKEKIITEEDARNLLKENDDIEDEK